MRKIEVAIMMTQLGSLRFTAGIESVAESPSLKRESLGRNRRGFPLFRDPARSQLADPWLDRSVVIF